MRTHRLIQRMSAISVAVWVVAVAAYYLFFAKISFEGTTVTGSQGEPPITTTYSGQLPWLAEADPIAVIAMSGLSLLLAAGAVAAWRGYLAIATGLSILVLAAAYITGFSIGGLFFPGAVALSLSTLGLALEKVWAHFNHPAP